MKDSEQWLVIGKFGRPYGIKAQIKIQSFTEPLDNILTYTEWYIFLKQQWTPISTSARGQHGNTIWVTIEGYSTREAVAELTNHEIAISKQQLSALSPGEYYWYQLEGLTVINSQGDILGKIESIMPTGSNDVLVVEGNKRYLIPYLRDHVVLEVDLEKGQVIVDWDLDY